MRGIVFTEFVEFAENAIGIVALENAIEAADLPSGGAYSNVGSYPYEELETLIGVLVEQKAIDDVPAALQAFGVWLAQRFKIKYAAFFDAHDNALDFLKSIDDHIHVEVRKLYPGAVPPRVLLKEVDNENVILTYESHRPLANVALGLTIGSLQAFGGLWEISGQKIHSSQHKMTLELRKQPQ